MVAQTESPFMEKDRRLIKQIHQDLRQLYPIVKLFLAYIPVYPTGMWSFTMASKKHDPLQVKPEEIVAINTRYYNKDIHYSAFVLPNFVADMFR